MAQMPAATTIGVGQKESLGHTSTAEVAPVAVLSK